MALTSFVHSADAGHHHHRKPKKKKRRQPPPPPPPSSLSLSWDHLRTLLNCKSAAGSNQVHDPSSTSSSSSAAAVSAAGAGKPSRLRLRSGPSICALGDAIHGSARVVHRTDTDQYSSSGAGEEDSLMRRRRQPAAAARGGVQLMRLSGCYECRAVDAEPASRRYPRPRTLCACPQCGEVFNKTDSLELHQTIRHAVSELGPDDSGRHIVEIIFKSSWQKNHRTICKIDRILKVHNSPRTIARFEDYRAAVRSRATAGAPSGRNPRCAADGNELLRFHSAFLSCHLGAAGSTSLCSAGGASVSCGACEVIRHGFRRPCHPFGVRTTASSGRAHEDLVCGGGGGGGARAMLVCRVIAGRVRCAGDGDEGGGGGGGYDSVAAEGANVEELFVANPRAILPCFVVIYRVHG